MRWHGIRRAGDRHAAVRPLLSALEEIPDPRRRQGRRYSLPHLLLFSVLAVLAGAASYRGTLVFIRVYRQRLNAVFDAGLRRAPAVNTLRYLFQALDPAALEATVSVAPGALVVLPAPLFLANRGRIARSLLQKGSPLAR